jgi:CRISPR-associated endoribonuclease Cas6
MMPLPANAAANRPEGGGAAPLASVASPPQTFDLYPLRFHYTPRRASQITAPVTANLLRGAFGSALKKISESDYQRYFVPQFPGTECDPADPAPSGLRDSPRPFVFRLGEPGIVGLNVFCTRQPPLASFIQAMRHIESITVEQLSGTGILQLPLQLPLNEGPSARGIRVRFLTPTELKGVDPRNLQPEFGILLARIRDRVSTLRALWGAGPLDMDFNAFGERASKIRMARCELTNIDEHRTSKGTGQRHSLGGFTGVVEYESSSPQYLAEFLPYLEIARWTGVGRQTVWGKGEISYETF